MLFQAGRGLSLAVVLVLWTTVAQAAPYAALVMDARDGRVIHATNADTRLHPASLTKMMTLYLVFDAIRNGKLHLDQKIPISRYAASRPPSKLGLRAGSSIELRYLIRASAVKSANDAAAALAEAVAGSESAFAQLMTATAREMGMRNTTFRNASGLTQNGHLSTARDMAILGRQLFYDFPEYYNLFSRRSANAKVKTVYNTNRRLLDAYSGADGIKTGYTRAAGFNLVSSAERGDRRVIVSMFGGSSSAVRNKKVAQLMDMGLKQMPSRVAVARPARISVPYGRTGGVQVAMTTKLKKSPRPELRPRPVVNAAAADAAASEIARSVASAMRSTEPLPVAVATKTAPAAALEIATAVAAAVPDGPAAGSRVPAIGAPPARPGDLRTAVATRQDGSTGSAPEPAKTVRVASSTSTAGGGSWVVQLGGTHNRSQAERLLLITALQEMEALEGSKREMKPAGSPGWYRARFVGLSEDQAQTACARLAARQTPCEVMQGG
ncbi:serine hydrolase [Rhodobacteraceae bacterium 2CG4]|uniref:Serine hydrolase n=1 Tax=Halovulum marinum TaxID=2662447 RepID=A0A6L5YW16_9RHOB|nr:D-alanyl-D-alanine carboxypeptidase [Halovulum marinum]MSU88543.1 serine hydrolase [Halovulum marinum]